MPSVFVTPTHPGSDRIIQEFRKSGISDATTKLNAHYISGDVAIETLAETAIAGVQSVSSYVTVPAAKILKRYEFAAAGGWVAYGTTIDGGNGAIAYFKPNEPRRDFEDHKLIKYETPQGCTATPLLVDLPPEGWQALFIKHKATPLDGEPPWRTVQRCNLPVALVEGWKKALALADHGIAAICLRGVTQWHSKGGNELWDAIADFATSGRKVFIFFDEDEKEKTRQNVNIQRMKLAAALELSGCSPLLPRWDMDMALGKGIDDVLLGLGNDAQNWLDALIKSAPSLKTARHSERLQRAGKIIQQLSRLTYPVERATEGTYLPELPPIERGAIHALSADMDSGKTYRIGRDWVKAAIAEEWNVLVLNPSNSLGRQTAQTLELPHIHDYDKSVEGQRLLGAEIGYAHGAVMCPDSLHRLPQWFFDRPVLLILDEANEVFNHMAEGGTLKDRYSEIWEKFVSVAQEVICNGAIVLSEASLPDRAIDLARSLSDTDRVRVFTHSKQVRPWNVMVFKGQVSGYRARFLEAAGDGKQRLFVTTSQKEARRLERVLNAQHPSLRVVRVDSQTNRGGVLNGLFRDPDQWLQQEKPDVLILSPSAKSGVSIEGGISAESAYFCEVWGYFPAFGTDSHMQLLGRYRPPVPRVLFCPPFVQGNSNEAAAYPSAIARHMRSHTKLVGGVYGLEDLLEGDRPETMLTIEAAVANYLATERSVVGSQKMMAHDELIRRLDMSGHQTASENLANHPKASSLWKQANEEIEREDATFMAGSIPTEQTTPEWARKQLQSKECSLEAEALAQKILLQEQYPGVPFDDPEDCYRALFKDYGSMRRGLTLQAHAENLVAAQEIDKKNASSILEGKVRAFHRLPKSAMRANLIAASGILTLCDGTPYHNQETRAIAIKANCLQLKKEISTYLAINVNEGQTPVEICNKLLKRIGLKGEAIARPGARGKQSARIYQVEGHLDPFRLKLLNAIRSRLLGSVSKVCNIETLYIQMEDTHTTPPPNEEVWGEAELLDLADMWRSTESPEDKAAVLQVAPPSVMERVIAIAEGRAA